MILRPARPEDAEALASLAAQITGAPRWPAETYRTMAIDAHRLLLVAENPALDDPALDDPAPVAFAAAALIPPAPIEAELESIAVHPGLQRQGLGRQLLRAVQQWAATHAATVLQLEVRASNHAAQALYQAGGFITTGRRRAYYHAPTEDALLMQWTPGPASSPASGIMAGDYGS